MTKRYFDALKKSATAQRRHARATARRAIWAAIQHEEIGVGNVDLYRLVEDSIAVAEKTISTNSAIGAAEKLFKKQSKKEQEERRKMIAACNACKRARDRVGFPGMPSYYRYCEDHR